VVRGESTFPGIQPATRFGGAARQRPHSRGRNRAITHAADIDDGSRHEWQIAATLANLQGRRDHPLFLQHGKRGVDEYQRAGLFQIIGRAEPDNAPFVLGESVNPAPRCSVERHLIAVTREHVLAQILTQLFQEVAQSSDNGKVAQHGVLLLGNVLDELIEQCEGCQ